MGPAGKASPAAGKVARTPLEAAKREAREEAGIPAEARFIEMQAMCSVPVYLFRDGAAWGATLYIIPEYSFGGDCTGRQISLSREHSELQWLPFAEARERLPYDSNRTALWELHQKLKWQLISPSMRRSKRNGWTPYWPPLARPRDYDLRPHVVRDVLASGNPHNVSHLTVAP
jgi:dATP pyrophosphohydrolase